MLMPVSRREGLICGAEVTVYCISHGIPLQVGVAVNVIRRKRVCPVQQVMGSRFYHA